MLCRSSLELETKSKRTLHQGEGRWGLKRPCVQWPQHPTLCQLGRDPARAHFRKGTKLASGRCIRESKLSLGSQSQPQCVFAQESSAFRFLPWSLLAQGPRMVWASSCSVCTGAFRSSLELETNSKCALLQGEGGWGLKSLVCTGTSTPPFASYEGRS